MKKFILIIALALTVFVSCASQPPDPLGYQAGISRAVCLFEAEGEVMKIAVVPGSRRVEVIEPEFLSGIYVENAEGGAFLVSEGVEMELPPDVEELISPLAGAFSLRREDILGISEENGTKILRVSANGGEYTVTLGKEGEPTELSFIGAREFSLKETAIEREEK